MFLSSKQKGVPVHSPVQSLCLLHHLAERPRLSFRVPMASCRHSRQSCERRGMCSRIRREALDHIGQGRCRGFGRPGQALWRIPWPARGVPGYGQGLLARAGADMMNMGYLQYMWGSLPGKTFWQPAVLAGGGHRILHPDGSEVRPEEHIADFQNICAQRGGHCPYGYGLDDSALDLFLAQALDRDGTVTIGLPGEGEIRVAPMAHASNGGAVIGANAETSVPGLLACGECATGMPRPPTASAGPWCWPPRSSGTGPGCERRRSRPTPVNPGLAMMERPSRTKQRGPKVWPGWPGGFPGMRFWGAGPGMRSSRPDCGSGVRRRGTGGCRSAWKRDLG